MQSGERPSGLAAFSLYDMARRSGPTLFVIVIVQLFRTPTDLLPDLEGDQPGQAAEYAKYHDTEHKH
jgi:hypothetical protein